MNSEITKYFKNSHLTIIHENKDLCEELSRITTDHFLTVNFSTTASEALDSLNSHYPDLLVVSLKNLHILKEAQPHPEGSSTATLVIFDQENSDQIAQSLISGADDFISTEDLETQFLMRLLKLRLLTISRIASNNKAIEDLQNKLGNYKHEFANSIAVIEGKLRKIKRQYPQMGGDESYIAIEKWTGRLIESLEQLNNLRTKREPQGL